MAETALITGASSGIGEEFARQLSARGCKLILVARRRDRLEALAESLPTSAHVIAGDLGSEAADLPGEVARLGLDVDLLVNNAGFGLRGRFAELPVERQAEMVRVNCEAVVTLTGSFLPAMIERGRGGVITVASTAGMQPLPYEATYAATKAFALNLTDALHAELRGTGVTAMSVNPGPVPTEWQQVAGYEEVGGEMMPGVIEADQVVREALIAFDKGKRSMVPGRFFRNFMRVNNASPRAIRIAVSERLYRPKSQR
ncbi:MAG TPA: SDR family oxidoreductase [Solirubrobacterales bacterium]|nr:SDR family oxidoreductase [Solirubrobacterales bacterium]